MSSVAPYDVTCATSDFFNTALDKDGTDAKAHGAAQTATLAPGACNIKSG